MNPEKLLNYVSGLIDDSKKIGLVNAHICLWDKKIQVLRRDHTDRLHPVIFILTDEHLQSGLTDSEWQYIVTKLLQFYKENTKCQKQSKP